RQRIAAGLLDGKVNRLGGGGGREGCRLGGGLTRRRGIERDVINLVQLFARDNELARATSTIVAAGRNDERQGHEAPSQEENEKQDSTLPLLLSSWRLGALAFISIHV